MLAAHVRSHVLPRITALACGALLHVGAATAQCLEWQSGFGAPADGLNNPALCSQVFDDGSGPALYVGGWFTTAGAVSTRFIAKWDGSAWSSLGTGMGPGNQAHVLAMTVYDDGTGSALYVGGWFTVAGGVPAQHIAKWNGSTWSALGSGVGPLASDTVSALCVYDDGLSGPMLYVGGSFTQAGGQFARNLARWNGAGWQPVGGGVYNISSIDASGVNSFLPFEDGSGTVKLVVGGRFDRAGNLPVKHIAMWDGSTWSDLGGGMTNNVGVSIAALAAPPDSIGILFAGGLFDTAGGVHALHVARWNGGVWSALGDEGLTGGEFGGRVFGMKFYNDGTRPALFVGGEFQAAGGVPAINVAKWDGFHWSALGGGAGVTSELNVVYDFAVYDDSSGSGPDLISVGWFNFVDGDVPVSHVARWNGCSGPGILYCAGDAPSLGCPCTNWGAGDRGCENSEGTGGALLSSSGSTRPDTVVLHANGQVSTAISIFLQGDANIPPTAFGDGLRCVGGQLKRLYVQSATAGASSAPDLGEAAITARSAELGDTIAPGTVRYYQVYYRDSDPLFCPAPQGSTWNVTNAVLVGW